MILLTNGAVLFTTVLRTTDGGGSFIGQGTFMLVPCDAAIDIPDGTGIRGTFDLSTDTAVITAIRNALLGLSTGAGVIQSSSPNKPGVSLYAESTTDITPA